MTLWPRPADESPPLDLDEITREVHAFGRGELPGWEAGYLEYHRLRYQDTLRLLPPGEGRLLLDVGSFPGHLSALAQARGWEVVGLNNAIEGAGSWTDFLGRCEARKIAIRSCEVEREAFPLPTGSVDAVLFCELFEHLHLNPFHTLKEIFRVLRPGGLFILTTPNLRRVETLSRLWHGWGAQPPLSRTFRELFPSLLYHRHNREYTASELAYYLAYQGKDLYDFRLDRVYYSDALDAPHEIPGILGQRVGAAEQRLARVLRRLAPALRGQLIVRAWRTDAVVVEWDQLRAVEGFGPAEEDERPTQGFTRRLTFPFRLAGARAGFELPVPRGDGPVLVSLVVANPDDDGPTLRTEWTLDGEWGATIDLGGSPRPARVHLLVPARVAARGAVRVDVAVTAGPGSTGCPGRLHVGAQWVLVERLADGAAVQSAIGRVRAERRAEDMLDSWWSAAPGLYLAGARFPASLEIRPGDEDQLGPGWFWREDWGKVGLVRWTSAHAIAYLGHAGGAASARLGVYSGEARLGPAAGRVSVEQVGVDRPPNRLGETPFALPPDTWSELVVPFTAPAGPVRVTVETDPTRVPRALVPDSSDDRALGVVVRRIWLA
jgi:SAM-dependent methyltransferase